MAALPYMPLYISDYLADAAHLSTLEHGAYLLLIMTYWQRGKALPADDSRLANICRLPLSDWLVIKPTIQEFFLVDDVNWHHKRVEQELESVREKSDKAKSSARASWEKRGKKDANVMRTHSERIANAEHPHTRTQCYTDTDTDTDTDTNVDRSSYTSKLSNSFSVPPVEDIGEYKFMNYAQLFVDDMPNLLKNPQNRSRCADLFRGWHNLGVTPKDVSEAIKWKKSEGGVVTVPWFYEQIALEMAHARRQNREPRPYTKNRNGPKSIQEIIAETIAIGDAREAKERERAAARARANDTS